MGLSPWRRFLNTAQIKSEYSEKPAGLKWRSNTYFILATVAVGLFSDLFLYALVVPVLPFLLEDRIGIPSSEVQTYTSALLAALAGSSVIFSPVAGIIADKVSTRQAPFLIGLLTSIAATVLLFQATSIAAIVIARVLQGLSGATVWTVGLAICVETVGPKNLGKTIGTMFSFISVGALWSPILGGLLYERTGSQGVMAMSLAVLGVDLVMRVLVIEKKVAARYGLDESTTESSNNENENGAQDGEQSGQEANDESQPLLGQVEDDEDRYKLSDQQSKLSKVIPLLPCLAHPGLLTAQLLALVQALVLGSMDATVPIVSRELFEFDSLQAGLLFFPLGILDLLFGPIAGWMVDRYGTKPVTVFGLVYLIPTFILLRIPHAGGNDQAYLYGGLLGVTSLGLAAISSPSIVEAGTIIEKFHKHNPDFFGESGPYAQLYGLNSAMFNLGLTIGPELAGELKQMIGYGNMNIVIAGICGLMAILSYVYIGGKPKFLSKRKR